MDSLMDGLGSLILGFILIIVVPVFIVFGIKSLVAGVKQNELEEKREQERQEREREQAQEEARRKARRAELRKHPVMTKVYEEVRKAFPSWVRNAKQTDTSQSGVYGVSIEADGFSMSAPGTRVTFASLGYASLSGEDRLLFAQALRGMLVTAMKDTKARVGEVVDQGYSSVIPVDLSAYQKPLKPF